MAAMAAGHGDGARKVGRRRRRFVELGFGGKLIVAISCTNPK
jgi:hypothetical protein